MHRTKKLSPSKWLGFKAQHTDAIEVAARMYIHLHTHYAAAMFRLHERSVIREAAPRA